MKLEQQVTSLEISKRLKELGVKQESYFWWELQHENVLSTGSILRLPSKIVDIHYYNGTSPKTGFISAFTVAELGEMFPKWVSSWCDVENYEENGEKYGRTYVCGREQEMKKGEQFFVDLTEADARGKMLVYLLENNLISLS